VHLLVPLLPVQQLQMLIVYEALLLLLLLLLLKSDVLPIVTHLPVRQYTNYLLRLLRSFTSLRLYCCLNTSCC
jgi:hypothetical protein